VVEALEAKVDAERLGVLEKEPARVLDVRVGND
jgi:hypothetical protein